MPRLFWPNFDFEHELAAGDRWQTSPKLRLLNARFAPVLAGMCLDGDVIVMPEQPVREQVHFGTVKARFVFEETVRCDGEFAGANWELIPWGVTNSLKRLAEQRGWTWHQPSIEVVTRLNDRLTSFEWENQWKMAPEGATILRSETDLEVAVKLFPTERWVIKARFGMTARERIVGQGTELTATQRGWLKKRLVEQQSVILEPWLEAICEAGLQFDIPKSEPPRCLAVLPLLNSATGEYRGSRLFLTEEEQVQWQPAIDIGTRIASEVQSLGYYGPLGIDAMQYRIGDEIRVRSLQDINARWTMGRIAWEWGERIAPGAQASWLSGTAAEEALAHPPTELKVIPTSLPMSGGVSSALVVGNLL